MVGIPEPKKFLKTVLHEELNNITINVFLQKSQDFSKLSYVRIEIFFSHHNLITKHILNWGWTWYCSSIFKMHLQTNQTQYDLG